MLHLAGQDSNGQSSSSLICLSYIHYLLCIFYRGEYDTFCGSAVQTFIHLCSFSISCIAVFTVLQVSFVNVLHLKYVGIWISKPLGIETGWATGLYVHFRLFLLYLYIPLLSNTKSIHFWESKSHTHMNFLCVK